MSTECCRAQEGTAPSSSCLNRFRFGGAGRGPPERRRESPSASPDRPSSSGFFPWCPAGCWIHVM